MNNIFSKTKIILLPVIISLSLVACGGDAGTQFCEKYCPKDGDKTEVKPAKKTVDVRFGLTGRPPATAWVCKGDVSISPGGKTAGFTSTSASGSIALSTGKYTATVEVSCGCILSDCYNDTWAPGLLVTSNFGNQVAQRALGLSGGWKHKISLEVGNGTVKETSSRPSQTVSAFSAYEPAAGPELGDVALIEYVVIEDLDKDASGALVDAISCEIGSDPASYGGFDFQNVRIKNTSGETLQNWSANLSFSEGVPSPEWFSGVDSVVQNGSRGLLAIGNDPLEPGEEISFSVGGTYSGGQDQVSVECF